MEKIGAYVLIFNVCLSALSLALHKLVEAFPSLKAADDIAGKIVGGLQKLVDLLSANIQHKDGQIAAVEQPKA